MKIIKEFIGVLLSRSGVLLSSTGVLLSGIFNNILKKELLFHVMSLEFYCRIQRNVFKFKILVFYCRWSYTVAITADCPPIRQVARVSS
jgi:hypothetical protein